VCRGRSFLSVRSGFGHKQVIYPADQGTVGWRGGIGFTMRKGVWEEAKMMGNLYVFGRWNPQLVSSMTIIKAN
jgi:hypothetical protein